MEYMYILREALVWVITIFWLYQIIISLCSLVKLKEKPLKVNKEHKFIPYFIIQSIIWKKKSLVISWKIRYSYFTG